MSSGKRVAVVFGGRSVEHEISLRSARTVMEALSQAGFQPQPVAVTPDGAWFAGADQVHVSNEVAFKPGCPVSPRTLSFCSDPRYIKVLEQIVNALAGDRGGLNNFGITTPLGRSHLVL